MFKHYNEASDNDDEEEDANQSAFIENIIDLNKSWQEQVESTAQTAVWGEIEAQEWCCA